jgi:hypothetical protein
LAFDIPENLQNSFWLLDFADITLLVDAPLRLFAQNFRDETGDLSYYPSALEVAVKVATGPRFREDWRQAT